MMRPANWQKVVRIPTKLLLGIAVLLLVPFATAQNNLGELLDAGAKKLSLEEFKEEIVQRITVGSMPTGGRIEVVYARSGMIQGAGSNREGAVVPSSPIMGEWTTDISGRVCTAMRIGGQPGATGPPLIMLPARCQYWFKYKDDYFLADSDSDRSAKV